MASTEELEAQILADMESDPEAYADTEIEYCTVDDDTRMVTVPYKYRKFGVESDEKVKRIWFRFPKMVGNNGVDLSAIGVRVNFRNANGEGDIYIVEDLTTDGDYVTFSWELTRKVTAYKGNVSFVVCAVKSATDGTTKNEWNTTLNKECEVLEGLEVTEQIEQENPDIIEYILANLGGSVSAEQIAQAVEAYMEKNPPSGMTADEKAQMNKNTEDISQLSEKIADLEQNGTGSSGTIEVVSEMINLAGTYKGIDLETFLKSVLKLKANPNEPLAIETYDGGNQPTHPKVLYFPERWNGYKFWMAYTPWTNQNNNVENPCICYSDDSNTWSSVGITNPLATAPTENGTTVGYNSDSHIVMVGNTMECWWRTHYQSGTRAGYTTVSRRTSTDGINWTEAEELFSIAGVMDTLSPTVIYMDGIYKIWLCYGFRDLVYYESTNGYNWQKVRNINVNLTDNPTYKIWHFDIIYSEAYGYEFVGCYNPNDTTKNHYIYYAQSDDNVTYTTPYMILEKGNEGNFDEVELYRPSLVRVGNGIMLFYGAHQEYKIWHIGKVEATTTEALNEILVKAHENIIPSVTVYSVSNNLTNVETNNLTTRVKENNSYSATLTAIDGYAISSVVVTMGGSDITSTAYNSGKINISKVTGDIVITATAIEKSTVVPCTGIQLSESSIDVTSTGGATITATLTPTETTDVLEWTTSDSTIATVSNGKITPVSNGNCVITATCGTQKASCNVSISCFVDAIAKYIASNHGSVDGEWAEINGGNSIILNGATFEDSLLTTDGVDDYAVLPLTNAKTVKMKIKNNTGMEAIDRVSNAYYFDARTTASVYMLNYSQKDWIGKNATYYVDDTLVVLDTLGSQAYLSKGVWNTITIIFNEPFTGNMYLACSNKLNDFMSLELEYIYVYDQEVLPV